MSVELGSLSWQLSQGKLESGCMRQVGCEIASENGWYDAYTIYPATLPFYALMSVVDEWGDKDIFVGYDPNRCPWQSTNRRIIQFPIPYRATLYSYGDIVARVEGSMHATHKVPCLLTVHYQSPQLRCAHTDCIRMPMNAKMLQLATVL